MELKTIATATTEGGGEIASFGSGETGGRTQASARGRAGRTKASPAQVRALRSRINRADISRRERRRLLDEIDLNARGRTSTPTRGILADIASDLADLL